MSKEFDSMVSASACSGKVLYFHHLPGDPIADEVKRAGTWDEAAGVYRGVIKVWDYDTPDLERPWAVRLLVG